MPDSKRSLAPAASGLRRVAVLLASHNRKRQTLACLESLRRSEWPPGITCQVYLTDDGSTDGTREAVREAFPEVMLIEGDGTLFWCNSMRMAWNRAARDDPDFYLWLNDDTTLLPTALGQLFSTWEAVSEGGRKPVIVVGSTRDPDTKRHTYGGHRRIGRHPARLEPVPPADRPQECDTFNGNIVLVPRDVYARVGNMRPFAHSIGDTDYGLRARAAGCSVVIAAGYLGECRANDIGQRFVRLPFLRRLRGVFGRKIFPPASWFRFYWHHAGPRALLYWPISLMGWLFPFRRRGSAGGRQ